MNRYLISLLLALIPFFAFSKSPEAHATIADTTVYTVVDKMPEFPGGSEAMIKFLSENLRWPKELEGCGIQGRPILQFIIEKDGSLTSVVVVRGVDPLLDKEAVRVIKLMPKWIPGEHKGKKVRVKYTLPVSFRLE